MSFVIGTVAAILNSASDDARRNQAFRSKVAHLDRCACSCTAFSFIAVPLLLHQLGVGSPRP